MGMRWAIQKSYGIKPPDVLHLVGAPQIDEEEVEYLEFSLGPYCITEQRLTQRANAAITMLRTIMRITKAWRTTLRQRREILKTFIYSIICYVLYLQPLTEKMLERTVELEILSLPFITGVNIGQSNVQRVLFLTRVLLLKLRRLRHLITAVSKFYQTALEENTPHRAKSNWETLAEYSMISPFIKSSELPETQEGIPRYSEQQL